MSTETLPNPTPNPTPDPDTVNPESLPISDDPNSAGILDFALDLLKSFALTLWDMFTDLLLYIVDKFVDLGFFILSLFSDVFELINLSKYIDAMPPEVHFVFTATGLSQAVGMIMLAGTARLLMQLIPFVRLGS